MACIDCRFFRRIEGETYCKHYDNKLEPVDRYCLDKPCPYEQKALPEPGPMNFNRIEQDLDSIEVSADPRRKINFNTRSDTQEQVEKRIIDACKYTEIAMNLLKGEDKK
jgi:hypothetical protein